MKAPVVSIVMPLYNAQEYLSESIESVLSQEFSDWELVIVDDCSTDSSRAIAERYAAADHRIVVRGNGRNMGAAATRTAGLKYIRGRYLAFLDADDAWLPRKLAVQLRFMEERGSAMCFTSYETIEADGTHRNYVHVPASLDYDSFLKNTVTCSHTIMFDLTAVNLDLLKAPAYDFDYSEDLAVWLQVVQTGIEAHGLNEVLAKNRKHGISRSANKFRAIRRTWSTYRRVEGLGIVRAIECITFQLINAIRKRARGAEVQL